MSWIPRVFPLICVLALAACAAPPPPVETGPRTRAEGATVRMSGPVVDDAVLRQAARTFVAVVEDVEPIAEQECRLRNPGVNCDFLIVVDDTPNAPPNAFQTLDETGRPIIGFTLPLILEARNADEVAFILSHEAAHHIAGHLARQQRNAAVGAIVFGRLAGAMGRDSAEAIRRAQQIGAEVGARRYSQEFELEADALGTIVAARAGYDPVRGAEFFFRIPDPGDQFLGTHPPNAERVAIVLETAAQLGL